MLDVIHDLLIITFMCQFKGFCFYPMTPFRQQPASPGTQDAIQGMLAIAQPQKSASANKSDEENVSEGEGRKSRRVRKRKYLDDFDDDDEEMRNCFQDAKYGKMWYPPYIIKLTVCSVSLNFGKFSHKRVK